MTLLGAFLAVTTVPALALSAWTGGGPGTTTVVSDGTVQNAQFTYSLTGGAVYSDQTWDFHTTAAADGTVTLPYCWTGFHAFYQVTAHLQAYVTHNSVTTYTSLVNAGPVNCCTAPSGGFHYTGSVTLTVQAGDTYGFVFGGSNYDSDARLQGTLTVATIFQCPLTQGYWKNHPEAWPVSSLLIGGTPYTQTQLLAILNTPTKGDATLILADETIAAMLNTPPVCDLNTVSSDPQPIAAALMVANSLLASNPIGSGVSPSSDVGQQMVAVAQQLDDYNNGLLTVGCTPR